MTEKEEDDGGIGGLRRKRSTGRKWRRRGRLRIETGIREARGGGVEAAGEGQEKEEEGKE